MATLNIMIDPKTLECSLCLETLSDPRILPCGHTFCGLKSPANCLQKLDPANAGTIKCPNCQTDHQVRAADVPPDIKCKEMLESLDSKRQEKRKCQKHGEEIVMRCKIDGEEVCVSCVTEDHCGHEMKKIHTQEHIRLSDFWTKENSKLEEKQMNCKRRKDVLQEEAESLKNQRLHEDFLDNQLGILITRRDVITRKLASDDFNPDDEDIMALIEYMDQLEATSDCQQEASEDVRERSQQLVQLVDSSATATEGGRTSRGDVGRRTLLGENVNFITNILVMPTLQTNYILRLNRMFNKWEQWKGNGDVFALNFGFEAVCYKEKVYIIGGNRRATSSSKVDIFHIRESKWTEGPKLNSARVYAAACFVESERSIYICGGCQSGFAKDNLSSVEKLELDENGSPVGKWREVTPMKEKRKACAAVAVGHQLLATGGRDQNGKRVSSVEIFDTESNEWKYGPQMKERRSHHAVEHYDGSIYAIGGYNGDNKRTNLCEKLDLQTLTWTSIESMRVPRSSLGSVVANGKIYVVGSNTDEFFDRAEIYNPVTNKWSRGPKQPFFGDTKCVCW